MEIKDLIKPHKLQQKAQHLLDRLFTFFPFNLTVITLKRNLWLIFFWLFLFGVVSGNLGGKLGMPYLFLDPEYNHEVNAWAFFFVGIGLGGFIMAYHINCYILYAHRYNFLGMLRHPFLNFAINNSVIPFAFLVYYFYRIAYLQYFYENDSSLSITFKLLAFLAGTFIMLALIMIYFRFTNKNVFRMFATNLDKKLRKSKMQRQNIMDRVNMARKRQLHISSYFVLPIHVYPTPTSTVFDRESLVKVFDQNQMNAILLQAIIVLSVLLLGFARDVSWMQLPAAASILLLLTMVLMLAGAFVYWLRGWTSTLFILAIAFVLVVAKKNTEDPYHKAFGLSYERKVPYTTDRIRNLSNVENFQADTTHTMMIFRNWKSKFPKVEKPKMVLFSMSGGGQRAALWVMRSLQYLDSLSEGKIMDNTMFISGSSGGLIGASYFRELFLQKSNGADIDLSDPVYLKKLGRDKLNPMVFSMVVSDLFFRFQKFELNGKQYYKDRAYSLEKKILHDLDSSLGKTVGAYYKPEFHAQIPMILLAPTIVNDGRKLYISPQPISYMNSGNVFDNNEVEVKMRGIEFNRFFAGLQPDSLQFMTALRMNATFPYITPNVMLPSTPPIEILDAGLSDNFGLSDVIRFLYVFREWIARETSGVVIVSIRDTAKEMEIEDYEKGAFVGRTFSPLSILWENLQNQQDIRNDASLEYAKGWFNGPLDYITIEYTGRTKNPDDKKASLSWRLTTLEQAKVIREIYTPQNKKAMEKIVELISTNDSTKQPINPASQSE